MIIRKYDITLHRLKKNHIELVRRMRNKESIKKYMFYQEEITPAMQVKWFESINNIYNYYFLIQYKSSFIGLVHGKNINYEDKTTEGGIFIWDEHYWSTPVPALVSIIMDDLTFGLLDMRSTFAEVHLSNESQINYNKKLGYEIDSIDKANDKVLMILKKSHYLNKESKVRKAIVIISKDKEPLTWDDISFEDVSKDEAEKLYQGLPSELQAIADSKILKEAFLQ